MRLYEVGEANLGERVQPSVASYPLLGEVRAKPESATSRATEGSEGV